MPKFLVTRSSRSGAHEVEAPDVRALVEQMEGQLVSLSFWCEDRAHLHHPDGQWHAGDWLLDEQYAQRGEPR